MSCGKAPHNAAILSQTCNGDSMSITVSGCDHSNSHTVSKEALLCIPNVTKDSMDTQFKCPGSSFHMGITEDQRKCTLSHSMPNSMAAAPTFHTNKSNCNFGPLFCGPP